MNSHIENRTPEEQPLHASKLDIHVFDQKGSFPFKDKDLSSKRVYEVHDETLRTPLEKADVFEQLLNIPNQCELWIVPVTAETTALTKSIQDEKSSALFDMLASVKDKMQFDRTFLIAEDGVCEGVCEQLKALGYTFTEKTTEELQEVKVEF
ncbi:hypothetical protein [Bacillus thermotolerans]|uniref:Uncharacterized protein n=1 Tax=Bacillus thermotolerans TaxID=1221996 RepID=A0A0F5HYC8_BACTR|nr:hypothetical protein [Bacillus thermotolerans]KKB38253.1 hypothetical protein QY97_02786 [Bacillus thermotolerans]KKB39800.1 hypothetical protein QY95_02017 [Bacillus thermotolerans]